MKEEIKTLALESYKQGQIDAINNLIDTTNKTMNKVGDIRLNISDFINLLESAKKISDKEL